jgi:hypothetical protein
MKLSNGATLYMANCEIRVLLASQLSTASLASFSNQVDLSSYVAWVQTYPDISKKLALANLIILNDKHFKWSTSSTESTKRTDVATITLHELGHAIGLDHIHSFTLRPPVMDGNELLHIQRARGAEQRSLSPEDTNLLIKKYGIAPTPTRTARATSTSNSQKPILTLNQNSNCREGPSTAYEVVYSFPRDTKFEIIGKYGSGWWQVPIDLSITRKKSCWIYGQGNSLTGNTSNVPTVEVAGQDKNLPVYDLSDNKVIGYISCTDAGKIEWSGWEPKLAGWKFYQAPELSEMYPQARYAGFYEHDAKAICGW